MSVEIVDKANCSQCGSPDEEFGGPIALDKNNELRFCQDCYTKWIQIREHPEKQN